MAYGGSVRASAALPSSRTARTSRASAWPDAYAFTEVPGEYLSIGRSGMYSDVRSGEPFILRGGKAYAVALDAALASWRLAVPGDPSQMGQPIIRNARGEWEIREAAALPQTGRSPGDHTVRTDAQKREFAATSMLSYPSTSERELAASQGLPIGTIRKIAADVDAARRAWRAVVASGAEVQMPADVPLTPREKAFIDRWTGSMSADNFAELMQYPRKRIDINLQSNEQRGASASSSRPAAASGEAASASEHRADDQARRGSNLTPEKTRIFRMLSSNPTLSYREIAEACSTSYRSVIGMAAEHGLRRNTQSKIASARSDLFDDFALFPETSPKKLAAQYGLAKTWVERLRREFASIRADWNALHHADIADNRPEFVALLTDAARQFVRQWRNTLSAANLAVVMKVPTFVIDAYMRSAGYPPRPAASRPEPVRAQESPQPGPSGLPLTDAQKAAVLEWGRHGMRPDSLATYLSMLSHTEVPQAAVEAFIASPEYQRKVRGSPSR